MKKKRGILYDLNKNKAFLIMVLPATVWFILFKYLPMLGIVIAFKNYRISRKGFFYSLFNSDWVGFENFKFLFSTGDAVTITRNTVVYNLIFIIIGLIFSVAFAIMLSELRSQGFRKVVQTGMFLPYFLSWVVVSYLAFSFLNVDHGILNKILSLFGKDPVMWYSEPKYWPFILVFMNIWKNTGYNSVMYMAAIVGFDKSYYEAAMIDGAKKWQQIKYITLPLLTPLMVILTLLAIGKIFYADFGLFYHIPKNSGALFQVTNVIDTYVYRGLMVMGDIGMSTAAGVYQSVVGFILVLTSNRIVKKISPEHSLF